MATGKHPRLEIESYYYFVNISYPFVCETMQKAEEKLQFYRAASQSEVEGKWEVVRFKVPAFYYFKFFTSKAASSATTTDFKIDMCDVDTDRLLPVSQRSYIAIQLELYTRGQLENAMGNLLQNVQAEALSAFQEIANLLPNLALPAEAPEQALLQVQTQLEVVRHKLKEKEEALPKVQLPAPPKPFNYPEDALNVAIKESVAAICKENGYRVFSDQSTISAYGNPNASQYYLSRPDLVLYNPKKLSSVCVGHTVTEEKETEEESEQNEQALRGGMTENKKKVERDHLGQLLGGMEKVAGDIAYDYLCNPVCHRFDKIQITGLLMDYLNHECDVYELTMDFVQGRSMLHHGDHKLEIPDAINRLISKLESN